LRAERTRHVEEPEPELAPELRRRSSGGLFAVLAGVGSDFEHRRVLEAVVERPRLEAATIRWVLESSRSIDSDFEQARLLAALAEAHPIPADLRPGFEEALAGVGSDFERGRVREALAE
jgi:hypothetical protein